MSATPSRARAGFTLVEVALAVAVGLTIIGGAVLGYNAVKDNASNSTARSRVLTFITMIEEWSSANSGRIPASVTAGGPVSAMWATRHPEDANMNAWGGTNTFAVTEYTPINFGSATAPAVSTQAFANITGTDRASSLSYITGTTPATPWIGITATSTQTVMAVKNYAVGINDKTGGAWWDVRGGK